MPAPCMLLYHASTDERKRSFSPSFESDVGPIMSSHMIQLNFKQVSFLLCLLWVLFYTSKSSFEEEVFHKRADHSSSTSSEKSGHNDITPHLHRSQSPNTSIHGVIAQSSDHNLAQSSSKVYRNKKPRSPTTYRGPSPPRKRKQDGRSVNSGHSSDTSITKQLIQSGGYSRKEALRARGKPTKSISSTETTSTVQRYNSLGYSKKEAKQMKKKGQTPDQWIREDRERQAHEKLNRFGNSLSRDSSAARLGRFGNSQSTSNSGSQSNRSTSPRAQSISLSYSGSKSSFKGADDEATSSYRPSTHPNKNGSESKSQ